MLVLMYLEKLDFFEFHIIIDIIIIIKLRISSALLLLISAILFANSKVCASLFI